MRLRLTVVCTLAFLVAATTAAAQEAQPKVVVEILGLRTWTRQMVEDSVAKYQPGVSLADHACAVILRDSVGFADAASMRFLSRSDTTWVALPLVEPELKDRVRFRIYRAKRPPGTGVGGSARGAGEASSRHGTSAGSERAPGERGFRVR